MDFRTGLSFNILRDTTINWLEGRTSSVQTLFAENLGNSAYQSRLSERGSSSYAKALSYIVRHISIFYTRKT
jgi:hypothetical protein